MSDEHTIGSDDRPSVAGEYVLGVLNAAERRAFEARMAQDPALRAEVEYWERRLGVLATELKPVDPPPRVWANIESALLARPAQSGFWQHLPFWRWAAIGSAAVAAASLIALAYIARVSTANEPLVATLETSGGQSRFVAAIDSEGRGLTIVPASLPDLGQRALELWLIAPGDHPRSLGLIEPSRPVHITLPPDLMPRVRSEATLAVSSEPPGGSPTGLPTGPVIASGKLTNL
ncbi:MAG TPA: anti-sigma factor [Xanthobacteraceae bacterium]